MSRIGKCFIFIISFMMLSFYIQPVFADIIIIIQERQKEKIAKRWTIADWFATKKIMADQDRWLALHTNPDNSDFNPELNIEYTTLMVNEQFDLGGTVQKFEFKNMNDKYYQVSSQMFLSDIVAASLGIPTLNIDLGAGGYYRELSEKEYAYGPLLRFFGSNNQDNNLVLGGYYTKQYLNVPSSFALNTANPAENLKAKFESWVLTANLQLYLLWVFGIEGNYYHYGKTKSITSSDIEMEGTSYMANVFFELWLLRASFGIYNSEKKYTIGGQKLVKKDDGLTWSLSMYF